MCPVILATSHLVNFPFRKPQTVPTKKLRLVNIIHFIHLVPFRKHFNNFLCYIPFGKLSDEMGTVK